MLKIANEKLTEIGGLSRLRSLTGPIKNALEDARSAMMGQLPDDVECDRIIKVLEA